MKLRPLHDRIIVQRTEAERTTASGLYIPESAAEKPARGKIVAVGPGRRSKSGKLVPMQLEIGQSVLFGKYAGTEVEIAGNEHLILRENDIIGVITD